jgi:putative ABC transport system permease protein
MLMSYIILAWRNIIKRKGLAFINVFGLSLGFACFSLIMLYALNESNFDRFHRNASNIFRVFTRDMEDNSEWPYLPLPAGPEMKAHLPGVKDFVRFFQDDVGKFIRVKEKISFEQINFADPHLLTVFSFSLKSGNPNTALIDPHSLILTESTAKKIFGQLNALGQIIEIKIDSEFIPFTVTAIAEDIPSNSNIEFNILGNLNYLIGSSWGIGRANDWDQEDCQTFVLLNPETELPKKTGQLTTFRKLYYPNEDDEYAKKGWDGKGPRMRYGFQPLLEMHTDTRIMRNQVPPIEPKVIWILMSIASGILLIACVNFTTLAIGRSANRAKEVGIRKVIGARKIYLILQFLVDALMLSFCSAVIGILIAKLLLPYLNILSGRSLGFSLNQYPELWWGLVITILITGLISGIYPALVFAGFRPVEVLKSKVKVGGANFFTKMMVTAQFVIAAALIASTAIILQQLHHLKSQSPGFNKENVIVVDAAGTDSRKIYPLFKQGLAAQNTIAGITSANLGLGQGKGFTRSGFTYEGKHKEIFYYTVDPDFLSVLGMQLIIGRNFDRDIVSDTKNGIIINQAMLNSFGWSMNSVIGQPLKGYSNKFVPVVIGVVKNFNYKSLSENVGPQMFTEFEDGPKDKFYIRIKAGNPSMALAAIRSQWDKLVPGYPLQFSFLDQDLDHFYRSEERWSMIAGWAGSISIFLSCLGLFGLATLVVGNRAREISVRKVLGAPVLSIVSLLANYFLKPVLFAVLFATPIVWALMNNWLQGYANRISIQWWVFALTGLGVWMLAFATICFQTIRAALTNPVRNLRTE